MNLASTEQRIINSDELDDYQLDIKQLLQERAHSYKDNGDYIQLNAFWRDGQSPHSVAVYGTTVIDFVTNEKFHIKKLLKKILGLEKESDYKQWLLDRPYLILDKKQDKPLLKMSKVFDNTLLNNILPIYDYPKSRGISEDVCKILKSGVVGDVKGAMKNRYCFPVFNSNNELIGLVGRTLSNKNPKYRICGDKSGFVWPAFVNSREIIKKRTVILTESPMDIMTLFECGIKNCLCLFGVELPLKTLNFMLRGGVKNIVISTNNDELRTDSISSAGNIAAEKLENRLSKYFDHRNITIQLPTLQKDWNETLEKHGKDAIISEIGWATND